MDKIKFTEEYLDKFFDDNFIEDDILFECLENREGTIEESKETFDNDDNHMILNIKLMMKER